MKNDIENLKKQISELGEEELFDVYEFVDDLILQKTILAEKEKGPENGAPEFEDAAFVQK